MKDIIVFFVLGLLFFMSMKHELQLDYNTRHTEAVASHVDSHHENIQDLMDESQEFASGMIHLYMMLAISRGDTLGVSFEIEGIEGIDSMALMRDDLNF